MGGPVWVMAGGVIPFAAESDCVAYTRAAPSLHSPLHGHRGRVQGSAIVSKAAMNIGVHVCF